MVLAALAFSLMVATVKIARSELSPPEIILWRALIALPLAAFAARGARLRIVNKRLFLLRAVLGFAAMSAIFTAAGGLALADLSLIRKLQPILIAMSAGALLGQAERPDGRVWISLALGLGGSAILIGPQLAMGSIWGLWALLSAVLSAGAHLCLRVLGRTESARAQVFWFQVALIGFAFVAGVAVRSDLPRFPSETILPYVVACGVLATIGQLLLTRAYAIDQAARVAGAAYTGPVWAALLDAAVFATWPRMEVWVGGGLVMAAGLLVVWRPRPAPTT